MEIHLTLSLTHTHTLYLDFGLLGPDLWHLHTLDQTHAHTRSHIQTRSNTHQTEGGRVRGTRREGEVSIFKEAHTESQERFQSGQDVRMRREWRARKRRRRRAARKAGAFYPLRSLKSMQPKENQSALLSYAVPF